MDRIEITIPKTEFEKLQVFLEPSMIEVDRALVEKGINNIVIRNSIYSKQIVMLEG